MEKEKEDNFLYFAREKGNKFYFSSTIVEPQRQKIIQQSESSGCQNLKFILPIFSHCNYTCMGSLKRFPPSHGDG